MEDTMTKVIMAIMSAIIGIALICAGLIPLATDYIGSLTGDATQYQPLLYLVVIVVILTLIIGVLRYFSSSESR